MSYSSTITITVPATLYSVACAVARALDPDVGGADSFGPEREDATEYTTYATPCVPAFAQQALAMASNPAMLHYAVSADYSDRWPDLTPPTLAECQAFCSKAILSTATSDPTTP